MTRRQIPIPQGGRVDLEYAEKFYERLMDETPKQITTKLQD